MNLSYLVHVTSFKISDPLAMKLAVTCFPLIPVNIEPITDSQSTPEPV